MTPLLALLIAAAAPQGVDDAERAYREGRVAEARELYAARLERARSARGRGTLEFNLGNCAYRLGRPAEALAWYRRAELRLDGDADAAHNRGLAERALGLRQDGDADDLARADGASRPTTWKSAFLAAGIAAAGLAGALLMKRRALRAAAAIAAALAGAWSVGTALDACARPQPDAIVVAAEATLRAEPHAERTPGLRLAAGETVRVVERSDRWARVTHPRGAGWTPVDALAVIE
jgi:hypothetical protein